MGALFKSSIFLALAIVIGVYLYLSLNDEDVTSVPPEASVAPVAEAAQADIDDDLVDYLAARQIGSLEGWRAFLSAHGSGLHAVLARAEVEKLLHAEKTPAPVIAEVSHGASPDGQATSEAARPAAPPVGTEVAPLMLDEICKRDEERLERLRSSPSSEEAARFANELSCEKLRPQLLALIEDLGRPAPAAAAIGVANGEASDTRATNEADPPATPSADAQVAAATPDDVCKRDEERLERLRRSPSSEEAARFANELSCEKLRPQLLALIEDLGRPAPAAAAIGVANGEASDTRATNEADPPATPSADGQVAAATPDDVCKRDEERLERLRRSPSSEEAARFANELSCEKLRPQLLALIEDLGRPAPAAAAIGVANGEASDTRATNEADPPATPSADAQVAAATPDDVCKRDEERLERLRRSPSSEEAARFANELSCEKLRPQLLALIEDLGRPAPAAAAIGVANGEASDTRATNEADPPATPSADAQVAAATPDDVCKRDEERLERLRKSPSSEEAARFANELSCEKLRPQLLALIEDLGRPAPAAAAIGVANGEASDTRATNEADPPATPSADAQVAAATPDDVCKRDEERLERLRKSPSSEEAGRFANELGCEKLRPQISRLAESLGFVVPTPISAAEGQLAKGSLAQGQKAEGDCTAERDRLDRLRGQPSADAAQQLWRDLRCERLRPQVRLLLESLNVAADPSGVCRQETEELSRIRANPNRHEAEGFARDMTCEALRPQAARLLESLTE